ncbi:Rid family hydrolase [Allopusillimonas ginsengisoli]|uniref:Rid family hydrolase n=1 Tax=Allopusillimonas ginsengisoli TaxID=453575 RepID=UPI00142F6CE4|nr:Rid family hydrolase [Allopusillimonas ginsengisoli]
MSNEIERYGRVQAPGRPVMSLGIACADEVTICLTASNRTASAYGQTLEILERIDQLLDESASHKQQILTAQIWLRGLDDLPAFTQAWNTWVDHGQPPACSIIGAHLARPDILVEIKITAARKLQ